MSDISPSSAVLACAKKMAHSGLSSGSSGNISVRTAHGFLITPSALDYEVMVEADLVEVDGQGQTHNGSRKPSSEWPFHAAIYDSFPEANAVVHSHSDYATTLACLGKPIPAFHYMVAMAGGKDIRCSEYATFGSTDLARSAIDALQDRKACLLANHGQIAWHTSLDSAYGLAWEVEGLAKLYCQALQIGQPNILSDQEMGVVIEKFKDYRP